MTALDRNGPTAFRSSPRHGRWRVRLRGDHLLKRVPPGELHRRQRGRLALGQVMPDRAEAPAVFDREFIADTFRPLTPAQRAQWARTRRKRGRPRKGQGVRVIAVSVEKGLLARTDRTARRLGITRADLISRGLNAALIAVGER